MDGSGGASVVRRPTVRGTGERSGAAVIVLARRRLEGLEQLQHNAVLSVVIPAPGHVTPVPL